MLFLLAKCILCVLAYFTGLYVVISNITFVSTTSTGILQSVKAQITITHMKINFV
jgi:hypothetical protein